jgi:hypothetical protein
LHLLHIDGSAAHDVEISAQTPRLIEIPRDNPDLRTGLKGGGYRPRGTAGADDCDATIPPTPTLPRKGGGRS